MGNILHVTDEGWQQEDHMAIENMFPSIPWKSECKNDYNI